MEKQNALYLCNGKLFSNKKRTSEKHLKEFVIHAAKWMTFKNSLREISERCSVVSNSLWPHGLYSPWNSPGQDTGMGSLSLLRGSSWPRNRTRVCYIAGGFYTSWDIIREISQTWKTTFNRIPYTWTIYTKQIYRLKASHWVSRAWNGVKTTYKQETFGGVRNILKLDCGGICTYL